MSSPDYVDQLPEFVTWREGRCLPYGDGISFWALGEIVKAQAGILETDGQDALPPSWIKRSPSQILRPGPGSRIDSPHSWVLRHRPSRPNATRRSRRGDASWRRWPQLGPTVLVIEDLHWADEAFVAFLEHLAERTAGLPLLVVVTARPEVEERHPSWPPGRRSTVLSLSPLTDEDLGVPHHSELARGRSRADQDRSGTRGWLPALRRAAGRDVEREPPTDRRRAPSTRR